MGALLLTLLVVVLAVLVLAVVAAVLTAVPFVVAVDMAERRRFSTARWGGLQLVLIGLAAVVGLLAVQHTLLLALPVPLLVWAPALMLTLLSEQETGVGGYQGAHEA